MFFVGTEKLVPDGHDPMELDVYDFKGPGVALSIYNVDEIW
jgi:isocitrate dehydrogenase